MAVLIGKREELVVTLVALRRLGAVHVPLFTACVTGAIEMRISAAKVRLVVSEPSQRAKVEGLDGLEILETGAAFDDLLTINESLGASVAVEGDEVCLQLNTSGTTCKPKASLSR